MIKNTQNSKKSAEKAQNSGITKELIHNVHSKLSKELEDKQAAYPYEPSHCFECYEKAINRLSNLCFRLIADTGVSHE